MMVLNLRFVLLLISIFILSACGGGSVETESNANKPDNNNTGTIGKNAVAMVSSNADLSKAKTLEGSAVEGNIYVHFQEGSDWSARGVSRVIFYCCKNSSLSHSQFPADSAPPYSMDVDLSQYQDGNYELYIDVFFADQSAPVPFYVNFNIANSSPPVGSINTPPTISGNPVRSIYENNAYYFTPTVTDIDGDALTFNIVNQPFWATFNVSTGRLTGTPLSADIGIYSNVIISVTDGTDTANLAPFNIDVMNEPAPPANNKPIIDGDPVRSVYENDAYHFIPTVTDSDGDALTFNIVNQPSWATFNANTGRLTGTPLSADIGIYSNVIISVTDGTDTANLAPFNVDVMNKPVPPVNNKPIIGGDPVRYVYENDAYNFTPTVMDSDGDALTFNIVNQPSWTTFNASTGRLIGTPSSVDVGTYSNVIISVTDGIDTASLASFNIEVVTKPASNGSATLTWVPPTAYTDNSPLTNLGGYKIYSGTSPDRYLDVIDLPNPGIATYVLDNLMGNTTYYFVVTAYDANGVESGFSSSVSIFIPWS